MAVIFQPYSGLYLCPVHLTLDIETKVKRMIRQHQWMRPGDHIAVALTGTAADNALLLFFRNLAGKRRDIRVSGIPVAGEISDVVVAVRELGITRIALSTPLEMTATSLLVDLLRGDVEKCTGTGPALPGTPLIISPFCHIPAEEITVYARIHGVEGTILAPQLDDDQLFVDVHALLAMYSQRHPAAPHAILNVCDTLRHTVHHNPDT
ncbi:MAG: hypothetical protein PHT99_01420 [Methanoregula sp.]|nr:hypothetical protein [Methanoregula sp.]